MSSGSEKRARDKGLYIRLSADERAKLDGDAERAGLATSSHARAVLIGASAPRQVRRPPIERRELARLLGELGKIGGNLNQLTRAANSGTVLDTVELEAALGGLMDLREAILGALGRSP